MPIERAITILRTNSELTYTRTMDDHEFEATIRSAYKKAYPKVERPAESGRYKREIK